MYIVASFEHSVHLELAITALEELGIAKTGILAVPLEKRREPRQLWDTIHRADGFSLFDLGAVLGTCGMLLGAIYGFVLTWGPILWGLIGLVGGAVVGVLVKWWIVRRTAQPTVKRVSPTEVFLLVHCPHALANEVTQLLWDHLAYGVAALPMDTSPDTSTAG